MTTELPQFSKAEDIQILPTDPFAHDKLDRKQFATTLMQLVSNSPGPFVMALDGGWGTGKTTFLKMWQADAEQQGYICIFLNAWESDFTEDPLATLIAEIEDALKQIHVGDWARSASKEIVTNLKRDVGKVAKKGLKLVGLAALAHLLKTPTDKLQDFFTSDDTAEPANGVDEQNGGRTTNDPVLAKLLDQLGEEKINEYRAEKQALQNIKESLRDLALACNAQDDRPEKLPILFFIDELDRCRPTYAIELLEVIKHLFEVEGYFFVLAMNQEQLAHSIKTLYGQDMDATGYLARFFDIPIRLPLGDRNKLLQNYFSQWENKNTTPPNFIETVGLMEVIYKISDKNNISTRNVLKILCSFLLVFNFTGNHPLKNTFLLGYLFIALLNPKEIEKYHEHPNQYKLSLVDILKDKLGPFGNFGMFILQIGFLRAGISNRHERDQLEPLLTEVDTKYSKPKNRESLVEFFEYNSENLLQEVRNALSLIQTK